MKMLIRFCLTSLFLIVFIFNLVLSTPINYKLSEIPIKKKPNPVTVGSAIGTRPSASKMIKKEVGVGSSGQGKNAKLKTKLMAVHVPDNDKAGVEPRQALSNIQKVQATDAEIKNNNKDVLSGKRRPIKNKPENYHLEIMKVQDDPSAAWPLGIIHYDFDTSSFDSILGERVREVMDFLETVSCVQFKALSGKVPAGYNWISITNPERVRECSHNPQRKSNGEIVLTLGLDCLKRRDILHSLLHAMGFSDEVTHPHRDQYIRILWDNIQPRYHELFGVNSRQDKMLVEYDPMSIMHFHDRAFSRNGQATIALLMPGLQIQPTDKLSQLDKMKLRLAFGHECNRRTVDDLFDTCKSVMSEPKAEEETDDQDVSIMEAERVVEDND